MDVENSLTTLGLDKEHRDEALSLGLRLARVIVEHQDRYTVVTEEKTVDVFLEGKARKHLDQNKSRPVVGDWVGLNESEKITSILKRKNEFRRKRPGKEHLPQVLAANISSVFIVTSCNKDFSSHRLERFLLSAYDVTDDVHVVLNKSDLTESLNDYEDTINKLILEGTQIHTVSVTQDLGMASLMAQFSAYKTSVLVGSSGVGKSTLGNALLEKNYFPTGPIRTKDDKGRHTTTRRELICLPKGRGLLIDTPGLRDLSFWVSEESLQRAYSDIYEIATRCKYRNCAHRTEKECAVRSEYDRPERLDSYLGLKNELSTIRNI